MKQYIKIIRTLNCIPKLILEYKKMGKKHFLNSYTKYAEYFLFRVKFAPRKKLFGTTRLDKHVLL